MKKMKTLISTMLCLCTMCALALPAHGVAPSSASLASASGESSLTTLGLLSPQNLEGGFAGAPQYNISAPGDPEYGHPTSFEPAVTAGGGAIKNEDASKSAALIPPGFGTPSSYLPGSGEYLTPNLVPSQAPGTGQVIGGGIVAAPPVIVTAPSTAAGFTEVTGALYYSDGSLGTLKIPSIGLTVKVFEGTGSAPLLKGAGHFEGTSIWDGNCCIAGHNRGVRSDFGKIHTLKSGDVITFTTRLGARSYAVTGVNKVSVNDVSGLDPSSINMITLYTCVENQPAYRWCVTAVETV